ncbi:MAG TPA: hypothetical protein PLR99_14845 [Polyangiaceae bacterium]|nr:hypothetical protein [Polyangiaceae bacterium]
MLGRFRTFVLVVTPLLAVLVLVIGLRVGAKGAVRAATVWGAPPGKTASATTLAWQVVTFVDDRGVREAVTARGLTLTATAKNGKVATFQGNTNDDGVAEVGLDLDVAPGDELHVVVTAPGERLPLAEGDVRVPSPSAPPFGPGPAARERVAPSRPTKRTGGLTVDLFVTDERLVVGQAVPVVAKITDDRGRPVDGAEVTVTPEPGLDAKPFSRTCREGYAFGELIALFHTVGLQVSAKAMDGREGTLFAALPVAHGANLVEAPRDVGPAAFPVTVRAPATRDVAYVEIDSAEGRVFGTTLVLRPDRFGPSATFEAPALPPGRYWLVTSGDPRGAERIEDSTVARALRVHATDPRGSEAPKLSCEERADLSMHPGSGFVRTELLDGLPSRRRDDTFRERVGVGMGLAGLLAAAVIEVMLALAAVREARDAIDHAVREAEGAEPGDGAEAPIVTKRGSAGSVVVGLAVVVLGFALLAVLLVWKT